MTLPYQQPVWDKGFARPAPAYFPYPNHRTLAEVDAGLRSKNIERNKP